MAPNDLHPAIECAPDGGHRPRSPATRAGVVTRRHPELRGARVLIVEDDPVSSKLLYLILADEGCNLRVARSAEEAITILQAFKPRVVVLDLLLPRMSGLLFAEKLKSDPQTRDVVLVAVTSFRGAATEKLAMEAGCAAYVEKPIDVDTFAAMLMPHLRASGRAPIP